MVPLFRSYAPTEPAAGHLHSKLTHHGTTQQWSVVEAAVPQQFLHCPWSMLEFGSRFRSKQGGTQTDGNTQRLRVHDHPQIDLPGFLSSGNPSVASIFVPSQGILSF